MKKIALFLFLTWLFTLRDSYSQNVTANNSEYLPDIDGILKTKVEYDLNNSKVRFEVRNARFGAKGKINQYFAYRVEVDLSDEGVIKMLDAYVKFTPVKNLDFYMGQRKIPFSTDYIRNPAENIFANRSFIAKYINDGMRDIGFYANYKPAISVPVDIFIGAVNGTGNNNPQWIDKPNIVGRVSIGPDQDGIRVTGNAYLGQAVNKNYLSIIDGEIRYSKGSFFIESEYTVGKWTDTLATHIHDNGFYIHSFYNFKLKNKMIHLLTPTARYDFMRGPMSENKMDASRLTFGVNAGFEPKQFYAEIRLNYEKYLKRYLPVHTDKLTLEFIARF